MALWESGDSTGEVSLASLMAGSRCRAADAGQTIADVADLICRGGWPRMISMTPAVAQARLRDYLDDIARVDYSRVAGVRRDPSLAGRLLASLARNEATAASHATLRADLTEQDAGPRPARRCGPIWTNWPACCHRALPAWSVHLRSPTRLRRTPKRYFADPALAVAALAVAALAASATWLASDLEATGSMFESMAMRDLRVYAQSIDGRAYYYGDDTNLEADAILEGLDGQWAAVEIKLGGASAITEAMQSLRAVRARIDTARRGEPARLIVITAFGPGYQTDDGIAVVPLTALKP
jgi:hypothetical protein